MHTQSSDASSGVVSERQTGSHPPQPNLASNLAVEAGDEVATQSNGRIKFREHKRMTRMTRQRFPYLTSQPTVRLDQYD